MSTMLNTPLSKTDVVSSIGVLILISGALLFFAALKPVPQTPLTENLVAHTPLQRHEGILIVRVTNERWSRKVLAVRSIGASDELQISCHYIKNACESLGLLQFNGSVFTMPSSAGERLPIEIRSGNKTIIDRSEQIDWINSYEQREFNLFQSGKALMVLGSIVVIASFLIGRRCAT
jgi:hypothetical protein